MSQKKRRFLELVFLMWVDSESEIGWDDPSESLRPFELNRSVGFLVDQDLDKFVIAADFDHETGHFNRRMRIPKACVRTFRQITIIPLSQKKGLASSDET